MSRPEVLKGSLGPDATRDHAQAIATEAISTLFRSHWRARAAARVDAVAKRGLDIVGALALLFAIWPLLLLIAALVTMDGGPAMFRHRRIGQGGRSFGCLKFRSMMLGSEECLQEYLRYHPEASEEWVRERKLTFDPRITPIGRLLRATSLDELPQLFNVLAGDMSLVGPRPIISDELALYGPAASLYAAVRPGITGLWQISGRNDVSYVERVALDSRYVRERNVLLDIEILLRTPSAVLRRKGAR